MEQETTYGTPKSEYLKMLNDKGFFPIGITVMICEEAFIFKTAKEAHLAYDTMADNEGWYYGLDDKYPWEQTRKNYVDEMYKGIEEDAPIVYWIDNSQQNKPV